MSKKKKAGAGGIVYSTDPGFSREEEMPEEDTPQPKHQKLAVRLDTKQRAGKAVTLVEGFTGKQADLEELGRRLRNHCGTGGSVKDQVILVQGDQRQKVIQFLKTAGFNVR
jgi:translation initiation factor 1